jgi:uncharacterized protein YcbX
VVEALYEWPVKSMQGTRAESMVVGPVGAQRDRKWAVLDGREHRWGKPITARNKPQLLRWRSFVPDRAEEPRVVHPDGTEYDWRDPRLEAALGAFLGIAVKLSGKGDFADLPDSVLLTTAASHLEIERALGRSLDERRWRTNVHVGAPGLVAYVEAEWEGLTASWGDGGRARVLHPCPRCAVPTWEPDGSVRSPELLTNLLTRFRGTMGINLRPTAVSRLHVGETMRLTNGPAAS